MKILIIGGTSSIGTALKNAFKESDEVITAGRDMCDITIDLTDPVGKIIFPNDIDIMIHTAAHFGGKKADEIIECENVNVQGTLRLCRSAVGANVKHFVFISSIFSTLDEDSEHFGIYALSKKHAEEVAKFYCSVFSIPLTILRPSQIYGNQNSFRKHQPFFYAMVDKAEKGEDILLYGNNDAIRNFIHVDDLVALIAFIIENKVEGEYSCMHPEDLTYSRIANAAIAAFNSKGTVHFLKDKTDIENNIFLKDHSLYEKIQFYPRISIEEGMEMIATYRNTLH